MLDITEQYKRIGLAYVNGFLEAFEPGLAPAPEMHTMGCKVGLDAEMEVGDDEVALLSHYHKCRTIAEKFKVHSALTNPFWGW